MLSILTNQKILEFILFYPGFLFSLSFHEAAHGYVASKLGDPTAKFMGRVTLNPLPHMDPIGTFLLPVIGFFTGGFIFGWGKPVPVDYRNLHRWKRDSVLVSGAGPASNLLLAILIAGGLQLASKFHPEWFDPALNYQASLFVGGMVQALFLNLALTFFNLIPIYPLDGQKILTGLLPLNLARPFDEFMSRYGSLILIGLLVTGVYHVLVGVPVRTVARFLLSS